MAFGSGHADAVAVEETPIFLEPAATQLIGFALAYRPSGASVQNCRAGTAIVVQKNWVRFANLQSLIYEVLQ